MICCLVLPVEDLLLSRKIASIWSNQGLRADMYTNCSLKVKCNHLKIHVYSNCIESTSYIP